MKKLILFTILCACSTISMAQTFMTVDGIRYLIEDDHAVVARQDKELTGNITIPATITADEKTYDVTRLLRPDETESGGGGAFQECAITSVDLSNINISEIPTWTFLSCASLGSVTLPSTVTTIGSYAFCECTSLTAIVLPDGVTSMGEGAFKGAGLTTFTIPAGVTTLNREVLRETQITSLDIPVTITTIEEHAFAANLKDADNQTIYKTVKMGQRDCRLMACDVTAFGDMTTIDLLVPAGGKVVYQEYYPWMNMKSITEYGEDTGEALVPDQRHVTIDGILYMLKNDIATVAIQPATLSGEIAIPKSVTYEEKDYPVTTIMGSYWSYSHLSSDFYHYSGAFTQTQVTKVILPTSITKVEHHAFYEAQQLQEVILHEGITEIGEYAFGYCPELTTISIPTTITTLARGVLRECPKLKNLTLNEGITTLDWEALWNAGIETLTIPSSCTLLGYQALELPQLKTLTLKVKDPSAVKAIDYNNQPATMNGTVFGHDNEQEETRERLAMVDLIVPLGCAESYKVRGPWLSFRSITDEGSPYLKLNNSVFSAPTGAFTVEDETPVFEEHDSWYVDAYTHGLAIDTDTKVRFTTTATSWVYVYLFSSNTSKVTLDGNIMDNIGEDQSASSYTFYRYDALVDAGEHIIACNGYEGNQVPCMFLLRVQNISGDYYQPETIGVNINGINYILEETVNNQDETVRTAIIARQSTSLSGDIVIPEKVSYAKAVLEDNKWVTLEAHDYEVKDIVKPGFEIDEMPGIHRTTDGAFQESAITSISLPATLTTIPSGTFNGCQQLQSVTLAEGITTLGAGAFANCTALENIYLPETISDMSGWYIFGNCTSLKKVNIPTSVTALGTGCFMDSGLETFLIPTSLTVLGDYCFVTNSLKQIKICHPTLTEGSITFNESNFANAADMTLIVPEGKKETVYTQIYPWKDFGTIVEYTDQNDEHQYNAYRMGYNMEVAGLENPAAVRGHRTPASANEGTAGYVPSGIAPDMMPEKEGYVFLGWVDEIPNVMPAGDVTLKARFALQGDANLDGKVSITDAVSIGNHILGNASENFNIKVGDVNGDGNVTISDAVSVVNIILHAEH